MTGLLLGLALLGTPDVQLQIVRAYTLDNDHERAAMVLDGIEPTPANHSTYHFFRMLTSFRLNDRPAAEQAYKEIEASFVPLPRRYAVLADLMADQLQRWKRDDPADIARDMAAVRDRLQTAKAGPKTQQMQKDVVAKLDKLIKEKEDQGKGKGQGAKGEQDVGGTPGSPGGQSNGPAADSAPGGWDGKGSVDEKLLKNLGQNWGKLPPHQRQAIVNQMTRDLPPKYKPMIEDYYRALNQLKSR
jgi:hypothetical protein